MRLRAGHLAVAATCVALVAGCTGVARAGDADGPTGGGASTGPVSTVATEPAEPSDGGPAPESAGTASGGAGDDTDRAVAVLVNASTDAAAGVVAMSGYVEGTVADGQTCTYSLTDGTDSVEVSTVSVADASVTSCPWGEIPLSELHSGVWSAQLHVPASGAT